MLYLNIQLCYTLIQSYAMPHYRAMLYVSIELCYASLQIYTMPHYRAMVYLSIDICYALLYRYVMPRSRVRGIPHYRGFMSSLQSCDIPHYRAMLYLSVELSCTSVQSYTILYSILSMELCQGPYRSILNPNIKLCYTSEQTSESLRALIYEQQRCTIEGSIVTTTFFPYRL